MKTNIIFYDLVRDYKYNDVDYADGTDWEGIKCSKQDGHQRAGKRIGGLRIDKPSKKIGDFIWTALLSELIITEKVAELFNKNNFSGYKLLPVDVVDNDNNHNLWEFIVIGKGGDAHKNSGIFLKEQCDSCGLKIYSAFENGIIVDEKNWDGSDFFSISGYFRDILITERVKDLIEKNKLTGVILTPSHELKWPKGVIKP